MTVTKSLTQPIKAHQVAGHIGAEITGVDLGSDLTSEVVDQIKAHLWRHRVLFFRGQQHLTEEALVAFGDKLGTLTTAHPTMPALEENASILDLDYDNGGRANWWHSDATFVDRPPSISILRAINVPAYGGDTTWANTVAAYAHLPADLKSIADSMRVVHSNSSYLAEPREGVASETAEEHTKMFTSTTFETEHAGVLVHPVTGERTMLLGGFARQIVGMERAGSDELIKRFQAHITQLEHTVRWRWRDGDVAVSDNYATQHRVIDDWGTQKRRLQRVTVTGEVPVGCDGRKSVSRKGDSSAYTGVHG